MVIKYLGHSDYLIRIIGEEYFTFSLVLVEDYIVYFIINKVEIVILIDGINRLLCLFYSVIEYLDLPIVIC